jgi:dienelactone hydrolase
MSEAAHHAPTKRIRADASAHVLSEGALVTAAFALVALHVLDDTFIQPEAGTSAGDHLVSGLVPVALTAGAALAYALLRPGLGATAALLTGFFGVLSGSEAAYYLLNGGPSGDDFTGILAGLGGFVLLVCGAVTLWRSRRRHDSPRRRYLRRFAIAAGALALGAIVLFPTAIAYVVTHTARAHVPAANLGETPEEVSFTTADGLRLEGWFVPTRNGATVIAVPGRSGPQKHARMLIRHGYGVLLFDRRGEGASEGDPNGFGWVGDRDLHAAAAYLRGRPDVDPRRIGAIGLSVGGEMLIHAAAHSDAFKAIVSEGASGQSVRDDFANGHRLESFLGVVANTVAVALFTNTLPPPSLKGEVSKIAPAPVFFIYGEKGQGGAERKPNNLFYAAAQEPKQIWEVPSSQHIAGIRTQPAEYERRVIAFLDNALVDGR